MTTEPPDDPAGPVERGSGGVACGHPGGGGPILGGVPPGAAALPEPASAAPDGAGGGELPGRDAQEHGGCGRALGQCPVQEPAADPCHPARLHVWADDYVAGTLGQAERETLERELLTSAEARRFFLSYLELHAGLAWQFRGLECALPDLREVKPTRPSTSRLWRWSLPWASVLAVAAAVWLWLHGTPREPVADVEPVFAVVRETLRGRWADGREVRVSESVGRGCWSLESGLVSLEGIDGVELLVEGPAIGQPKDLHRHREPSADSRSPRRR
jgi:hypothetical protein